MAAYATDSALSVKKQLENALAHIVALEVASDQIGAQLQDANEAGEVQADTIATLNEEVATLEAAIVGKDKAVSDAQAEVARITVERDAALQAKGDFDKAVTEAASRKAFEITSGQGARPDLIPPSKPSDGAGTTVGTTADLWAQYGAIVDAGERTKFYNAHREEFLKAAR